ncbi:MAG: hypothetical protein IIB55_07495, partial [Planctomycetes bacterium]|nr:hypothetical protein [Planctomycetota bacterium]
MKTSIIDTGNSTALTCTVTVDSAGVGSTTIGVDVTVDFAFAGDTASVSVSTDGIGLNSGPATKTWVAGSLKWLKHDNNTQLLGGATFVVCQTHSFDSSTSTFTLLTSEVCDTVLDNDTLDVDKTDGMFELVDLFLGRYTITETIAPPDFDLDDTVVTEELTLSTPDVTVSYIWINTPSFEGLTPGFWQNLRNGGSLWNDLSDDDFLPIGGNPYATSQLWEAQTVFYGNLGDGDGNCAGSGFDHALCGMTMLEVVGSGASSDWVLKAARDPVAAGLNASHENIDYPVLLRGIQA